VRAESTRCPAQELACTRILAELRHRDPAQCQRRRIVAQRHRVERGERIPNRECARGSGDEGVHHERLSGGKATQSNTGAVLCARSRTRACAFLQPVCADCRAF
jgi:hypothetical protein